MFLRAEKVSDGSTIDADICVIGAGAAGLTFAREFLGASTSVCILESGHVQTRFNRVLIWMYRFLYKKLRRFCSPRVANAILSSIVSNFAHDPLYDFECADLPIAHQSRLRSFGGTMIAWGGKWVRYNPIDFSYRPWVKYSGWPITFEELDPYYLRASRSVGAPDPRNDTSHENFLGGNLFEALLFFRQDKGSRNWGVKLGRDFSQSQNVSVYTGAHVVSIHKNGPRIASASARATSGNTFEVRARYFVLACGGIENPRLLLISNIGNEHDQVGRYYMDHPLGKCGIIKTRLFYDLSSYWNNDGPFVVGFRLPDAIQQKECILNSHIFFESSMYEPTRLRRIIMRKMLRKKSSQRIEVRNHLEQAPVPHNRVTLSDAKDALGLPRARVSWTLSELDKKSIVVLHRYLQKQVFQAGIGELHSPLLSDAPPFEFVSKDAAHHMGTTRMGHDPLTSVVNTNCKIHTLDNMFVAGSSVFPTSGSANPTATICALAVRLADHIKLIGGFPDA